MKAYVFVTVEPGKSTDVVGRLRAIEGVRSAETCWGLPDIIALVEAGDLKALQDFVLNKIQKVAGVKQTDTHIIWEA
ncbi:MAG: Lrp/AsnC ligand binding domain-containing protein [Candidatus Acidoferrales bacterium]